MANFYIDYENVKSKGVDGIETLKKGDILLLNYSLKSWAKDSSIYIRVE